MRPIVYFAPELIGALQAFAPIWTLHGTIAVNVSAARTDAVVRRRSYA